MDFYRLPVTVLLLVVMLFPQMASAQSEEYVFADPVCERIVREAIHKPNGPVRKKDLARVREFSNTRSSADQLDGGEAYPVSDVSILRDLPNLRALGLEGLEEVDLSLLSENRTLKWLYLREIEQPVDFSPLSADMPLGTVSLYDVEALHLDAVLSSPSLGWFSYHTKGELVSDPISIDPLCETDALRFFEVNMPVLDIAPLARHNGLFSLKLARTTKEELLMMREWFLETEYHDLPYFSFVAPEFSDEDLALILPISGLSFYEADFSDYSALSMESDGGGAALQLFDCENVDPSTLPKGPAITRLTLERCGLTDLEFVREMPMIENLSLRGNEIRDISPLASLRGLWYLDVSGNPIADYTPLCKLKKERLILLTVDKSISEEQLETLQEAFPDITIIASI